jgi:hypothetical protein
MQPSEDVRYTNFRRLFEAETDFGVIVNDFVHTVRKSNADMTQSLSIVHGVKYRLGVRAKNAAKTEPAKAERAFRLLAAICEYECSAVDFAAFIQDREFSETPEEGRDRQRQQVATHTSAKNMSGLPTTQAQIAMLHRLGVRNIPTDRAEASKLIDRQKSFLESYKAVRKGGAQ